MASHSRARLPLAALALAACLLLAPAAARPGAAAQAPPAPPAGLGSLLTRISSRLTRSPPPKPAAAAATAPAATTPAAAASAPAAPLAAPAAAAAAPATAPAAAPAAPKPAALKAAGPRAAAPKATAAAPRAKAAPTGGFVTRPPAVAFQGSGLLGAYYSGVVDVLVDKGVISDTTLLAGISGGAYAAAATALGVSGSDQAAFWKSRLVDCARRYAARFGPAGCVGRLNSVLSDSMFKHLPENETTARVNGRVRIAVSQLNASSTSLNNSASWVIDSWRSKNDLISCLTTTDFLPCWTAPTTYTLYRNQPAIDGGYGNGYEELCPSGTAKTAKCLKIAAWVVSPAKANLTCSPILCAAAAKDNCTIEKRTERIHQLYNNTGFVDEWPISAIFERCPTDAWAGEPPNPLPPFVPMDTVTPDIMPGKYNPLPIWPPGSGRRVLACEWKSWSDTLPAGKELEAMDVIFETGRQDALAWCRERGC